MISFGSYIPMHGQVPAPWTAAKTLFWRGIEESHFQDKDM